MNIPKIIHFMNLLLARICFTFSSILLFFGFTFSQGVAIGQWREHLPYNSVVSVADAGNSVYAATSFSLFAYDKTEGTLTRYSKVNKLSDIGVSRIAWHKQKNTLIIGYSNGNIDLMKNGAVKNYADIKRANILGSKNINNIYIRGDSVYFSCDFGIVIFDIERREVRDSYFIGPNGNQIPVYDIELFNDTIYAATSLGVFQADLHSSNLADFNNWAIDSSLMLTGYKCNLVEAFAGKLIVNFTKNTWDTDTAYAKVNGAWIEMPQMTNANKSQFKVQENNFVVSQAGSIRFFDENLQQTENYWSFNGEFIMPSDFEFDRSEAGVVWIGDTKLGLIKNTNHWISAFIYPTGPYTDKVYALASGPGKVIGVPGVRDVSWNNTYNRLGYFAFENEMWTSRSNENVPLFDSMYDALSVIVDPRNPARWFIGSFASGVIEILNHEVAQVYNTTNTTMTGTVGLQNDVRVGGMTFDKDHNLWLTTSYTNQCISVRTSGNQWYSYALPVVNSTDVYSKIIVDREGNKWVVMPKGGGMLVFNENGTFANTADDKFRRLNTSVGNGNLPSMNVFSIAEDKDGRIWIGTDKGIAVFYYPQNIFTGGNFDAQQILVEVGGYVQPLMESETVNEILVDGANRKWIGTEKGGVFLLSPDGTEEILHFTTENSPLLSNATGSIALIPETGEVFFGTFRGLISYKGTATEAPPSYEDGNRVFAYPNPVRPEYNGTIAIRNLVYNSQVKITDIYGNLIYETRAHGGQAVWNGRLPDGKKPNTGVFLVFATDNDGSETIVAKILFIQ
jgi:hypothetical protein